MKDKQDLEYIMDKRKQSQRLVDMRYRNRVIHNINSDTYNQSLYEWNKKDKKGKEFNTNTLAKPDLDMWNAIE